MTDIITKDEIGEELFNFISTSRHIDNNGNLKKSDITNINTWQTICNDFAGIIISKINENIEVVGSGKLDYDPIDIPSATIGGNDDGANDIAGRLSKYDGEDIIIFVKRNKNK